METVCLKIHPQGFNAILAARKTWKNHQVCFQVFCQKKIGKFSVASPLFIENSVFWAIGGGFRFSTMFSSPFSSNSIWLPPAFMTIRLCLSNHSTPMSEQPSSKKVTTHPWSTPQAIPLPNYETIPFTTYW